MNCIKETILKLFVLHEEQSNGALESLHEVFKFYYKNSTSIKRNEVYKRCYRTSTFEVLSDVSYKYGLLSSVQEFNLSDLATSNEPAIICIDTNDGKKRFVVCFNCGNDKFLIKDSINGGYYATPEGLQSMSDEKMCLLFLGAKV